jgi:hypothetical protein
LCKLGLHKQIANRIIEHLLNGKISFNFVVIKMHNLKLKFLQI